MTDRSPSARSYIRAIPQTGPARPPDALPIAGGWCWATHAEVLVRGSAPKVVPVSEIPLKVVETISAHRTPLAGLTLDRPRLMGILNVTPDSFSDGGQFHDQAAAIAQATALLSEGADILDIGGKSTRPGAKLVETETEMTRTVPIIRAVLAARPALISIDTRKAPVARAALEAGAGMVNDVAAFGYDPDLSGVVARAEVPICLMHAKGEPKTMQTAPRYDDVLLDVYDFLEIRVAVAEAAGIPRDRIAVDPGIGFGKTIAHNLALLRRLSLFHSLGCAVLLGASRKRFIGVLGGAENPADRVPGSLAVALAAVQQGVQILRVHDMKETRQALSLHNAVTQAGDKDDA